MRGGRERLGEIRARKPVSCKGLGREIQAPGQTKGDALSAQRASVGMKKDLPIPHQPPAPARLTPSPSV